VSGPLLVSIQAAGSPHPAGGEIEMVVCRSPVVTLPYGRGPRCRTSPSYRLETDELCSGRTAAAGPDGRRRSDSVSRRSSRGCGRVVTAFPGSIGISRPSLALRDGSLRRNRWYNKGLGCRNLPSARVARSRGWDRVCLFSPKVRLSPMIIFDRPALARPRIPAGAYSAAGPSELGTSHQRYEVSS